MAEEHFTLTFEGPALAGGRMSVRELAPALLALSEALQAAQQIVYPDEPPAALDVHATREGSFAIDLLLTDAVGIIGRAVDLFTGREASAAVNLGSVLGYVWGAVELVKRLGTRRIRSEERLQPGEVRITLDNGDTLTIPPEVLTLARDFTFRTALEQMVQPLRHEGVDELQVDYRGQRAAQISKSDVDAFSVPAAPDEVLLDQEREVNLQPLNIAFQEGNKWRVTDGTQPFYASLADQQFLTKIMTSQERFGRGDILKVRLHTRQYRTDEGLRTDHTILEVLQHIRGPQEVPLPLEFNGGGADGDASPSGSNRPRS